jgi:hypothetical protein
VAPSGRNLDARGLELKEQDQNAKKDFKDVLDLARQGGLEHGFDEGDFFAGPDAVVSLPRLNRNCSADKADPERTVQDALQECFPNHGLRWL